LVEHSLGKGEVTSSILVIGSIEFDWHVECESFWEVKFWEGRGFSRAARSRNSEAALAAEVELKADG
jgi:hypothetical protein